jgi:hypothetical protein
MGRLRPVEGKTLSLYISTARRGVNHPPQSSAEVEGRVELYLYFPYGPSYPTLGRTLL